MSHLEPRPNALASRNEKLASIGRNHVAKLRSLRRVTGLLQDNQDLTVLLNTHLSSENNSPVSADEDAFIKLNSLFNGRCFDESTLSTPNIPHHADSIYASKPTTASSHPPEPIQTGNAVDLPANEAAVIEAASDADPMAAVAVQESTTALANAGKDVLDEQAKLLRKIARTEDAVVLPEKIAPPAAEEEAKFSAATKELLHLETPHRPAKVVHLPSEETQEERLRERREAMEEERKKSDSDKVSRPPQIQTQHEQASSPSSTVGAYSAATPMLPQDSPDTSPDSNTGELDVPPPKDLRPTPDEQAAQEEHDRLLDAQKELARKQALGDEATPDDQLRWEAREAAARDSEERTAREAVNGPEADSKDPLEQTEAQMVVNDARSDSIRQQQPPTPEPSQDGRTVMQSVDVSDAHEAEASKDVPTDVSQVEPQISSGTPRPHMVTQVSSGALKRKSASEVIREAPNQPSAESSRARNDRDIMSPASMMSPRSVRPAQDVPETAAGPIASPRRDSRKLSQSKPDMNLPSMSELAALRGAAEDPERDYLEPLFRIQAHDSPNSQTRPLADLIRTATKHLSTEDQFTSVHERMDYRILRRIYQLQNANKWSLRQMEKPKEPEQPVSHMDHMMAEMKWMRKDFKAERKMKKSVCAWLAARCADWVAADAESRKAMQVKIRASEPSVKIHNSDEQLPALDAAGDSAPEDDNVPSTPVLEYDFSSSLVVAPELKELVCSLQKSGDLGKALHDLPVVGILEEAPKRQSKSLAAVSKFVDGKVIPKASGPSRKRSRYDYEDDAELLESRPDNKRMREGRDLEADDQEVALFHPENKHIRDRLHANNAFRPPSEFVMPSIAFYEFRNGSQWVWEDDQLLRKLAKEYSFNWSLIADQMTLPSYYKSAAQRRTPWECFERWVELETLPAEMRKTLYFKTWFQRLEQSQNAAERRHQTALAAMQAQAQQNGQQIQMPQRRRTVPTRVEKRRDNRYLWLLDGMRKNARKKENNAFKQAEAQRAAAQRKSQADNSTQQRGPKLTPQEFSKRRQEQDMRMAEAQRQHRIKLMEAQKAQLAARAAQAQGAANQQRPGTANVPQPQMAANGQQSVNMNGQLPQQARPPLPLTTRNGHLAVPQVNAQGIPQAPMRGGPMPHQNMQRMAHANTQQQMAGQYGNQQYQMPNGNMSSPGAHMTTQQQLQNNQQLLAQMRQQQQQQQQQANTSAHDQASSHGGGQQMSASPNMPPPPTPRGQPQPPGQLSSGHMPRLMGIKNELREKHPNLSEDQVSTMASNALREQTMSSNQHQASQQQVRQNAMNAAAGLQAQPNHAGNMSQAYGHNQTAYQRNQQMPNGNTQYMNGDNGAAQVPNMNSPTNNPQAAAAYANSLRQRQQMQMMHQSPNPAHAQVSGGFNGSPGMAHASPSMTPASPSMQYANMGQMNGGNMGARPPSRSNTPQMQRLGSSSSVPGVGMASGMQSPSAMAQNSPRNLQANMAR